MGKRQFKPGNMLYPVPAVLVTVADREGNSNIFTVAWAGTICTNPPMLSISVRPERHSYHMMKETGEFVVNLTTESMAWATDYCGVRSGRDVDKWKETGLTPEKANVVDVPVIKESPVNIECRVVKVEELGSHHMFIADVVAVDVASLGMLPDSAGAYKDRIDLVIDHHGSKGHLPSFHGEAVSLFPWKILWDGRGAGKLRVQREKAGKGCEGWQENFKISGKSRRCRESSKVCRRERRKESNYPAGTNQKGE